MAGEIEEQHRKSHFALGVGMQNAIDNLIEFALAGLLQSMGSHVQTSRGVNRCVIEARKDDEIDIASIVPKSLRY